MIVPKNYSLIFYYRDLFGRFAIGVKPSILKFLSSHAVGYLKADKFLDIINQVFKMSLS